MTPTLRQQFRELLAQVRSFPFFFASYVIGFLRLFVTSVDVLSMLIFAILIGIITSAIIGGAVFFGAYVLTRALDSIAGGLFGVAGSVDNYRIHGQG